jgi:polysaccharide biosynthesis/export protein
MEAMVPKTQLFSGLLLLLAILISGCANTRGGPIAYNPVNFTAPDTPELLSATEQYRINPLDILTITVFQMPSLSGDYQVDLAGNIDLPLVGARPVRGKSAEELAAELRAVYGAKYLNNPQIQVVAKSVNPQTITVDGSVMKPGIYPVKGRITLIQAVAMASGTTEMANPRRVVIFRQIKGKREAAAFDLDSIRKAQMDDPVIYGNDIIVVDGSDSKSNFRDVIRSIPILSVFMAL